MKKIYAITGALGHLGREITRDLLGSGASVRILLFDKEQPVFPGTENFWGDVNDPSSLVPFLAPVKDAEIVVIHAAGIVSINAHIDQRLYAVNVRGTANMLMVAQASGVHKFIYVSSVHAIPTKRKGIIDEADAKNFAMENVHGGYAKTKAMATDLVLGADRRDFHTYVVAPSGIIGPGPSYSADFLGSLVSRFVDGHFKVAVRGGYDFVDVRDVAKAISNLALMNQKPTQRFYILSGHYYSVKELLDTLARVTGNKRVKIYFSPRLIRLFAWIAEAHYRRKKMVPLFTAYSMTTLTDNGNFSHEAATRDLNFTIRPLAVTLKDTVTYLTALKEKRSPTLIFRIPKRECPDQI